LFSKHFYTTANAFSYICFDKVRVLALSEHMFRIALAPFLLVKLPTTICSGL